MDLLLFSCGRPRRRFTHASSGPAGRPQPSRVGPGPPQAPPRAGRSLPSRPLPRRPGPRSSPARARPRPGVDRTPTPPRPSPGPGPSSTRGAGRGARGGTAAPGGQRRGYATRASAPAQRRRRQPRGPGPLRRQRARGGSGVAGVPRGPPAAVASTQVGVGGSGGASRRGVARRRGGGSRVGSGEGPQRFWGNRRAPAGRPVPVEGPRQGRAPTPVCLAQRRGNKRREGRALRHGPCEEPPTGPQSRTRGRVGSVGHWAPRPLPPRPRPQTPGTATPHSRCDRRTFAQAKQAGRRSGPPAPGI